MGVNSLPKTVTRQRRDCDLNPGPSAPESSTLITRLYRATLIHLLLPISAALWTVWCCVARASISGGLRRRAGTRVSVGRTT